MSGSEPDLQGLLRQTGALLAGIRADRVAALGEALSAVIDTFQVWLHFPDAELLYLNIAALLANRMDEGDPVWVVIVGGSSRGKTETLGAFAGLPDVRIVGSLTEASLLSGTPKKERAKNASGGLLRELPEVGATLIVKDLGAILTLPRDRRAIVVQALRDVYDGRYVRDVGTSGGQRLEWTGRLGLLAGATGALDGYHSVVGALGERWLTLRLPTDNHAGGRDDEEEMARRALAGGQTRSMRTELSEALRGYVEALEPPAWARLHEADEELVIALSVLVTTARSPVERDPHGSRMIESVPQGEGPGRFARQLHKLTLCLYALGLDRAHVQAAIRRLAFDSIPPTRRQAFEYLLANDEHEQTAVIARAFGLPTTTVSRVLQDLEAHGLLHSRKAGDASNSPYEWCPTDRARSLYARIEKALEQAKTRSPEKSQSPTTGERQCVDDDFSGEPRSLFDEGEDNPLIDGWEERL